MSVIGIDYGNLDCVIAQAKRGGIDIILNENSNRKNPNMICFQGKQRLIGEAAISVARMHFKNTATAAKRLLGRKFNHPEVQLELKQLPFRCIELNDGTVGIVLSYDNNDVTLRCEQVVAMMLSKLSSIAASANASGGRADTVISVPAYFSDIQRRALLDASEIAGLNTLRIINEPTAIALAFGIYKSARNLFSDKEATYTMFIDIGHSAYTVSIVSFVQGKLEVKSIKYDRYLGGRDFDLAIAEHVGKQFFEKTKLDPLDNPKARMKLLTACEKAKKNLSPSGVNQTNINIECLIDEHDFNGVLTLETFNELIDPILQRLEKPIVDAIAEAAIDKKNLSSIEIVGGGSRVSSVKRKLSEILELDQNKNNFGLSTTLNADECVARGCALQCAILSPLFKVKEFHIADKVLFPVKVSWDETNDGTAMEINDNETTTSEDSNSIVILTRNDDFPKTKRITFRRTDTFSIDAAYDESSCEYLPENLDLSLGKFTISGIPKLENDNVKEIPRIRVNVRQNLNGLFGVQSAQLMQEIVEAPPAPVNDEDKEKTSGETATPKDDKKQEETNNKDDAKKSEEEKKDEKEAEVPKKKRFKKIELKVESFCRGLSKKDLEEARENELKMAQQDRIIEETANKRNELESYIYDARSLVSDKWSDFMKPEEKTAFETKLQDSEDWLYTDEGFDSTKSIYVEKLKELLALGKPVEMRLKENTERPMAQTEIKTVIEEYKKLANSSDDAYSHWTDDDRNVIRKACDETETWLYEQLSVQSELNQFDDPKLLSTDIRKKGLSLRDICKPIVSKPKPKPETVEAPKVDENSDKKPENSEEETPVANKEMDLD